MDKRHLKNKRENRINGHKNNKIGLSLGIHDKNGIELNNGDEIMWRDQKYIILWNTEVNQYYAMNVNSQWYGRNKYSNKSYGKGYPIPMDDGARMEIEKI